MVAVGTGQRTTPAGVEAFALRAFAEGLAHTVLAVPIAQERATMHLDTICTMVDRDAVVMFPAVADTLSACTVTPADDGGLRVSEPAPFLEAAAAAMGLDRLRTIDTGLDPVTAEREQWDDGNNTLALAPGAGRGLRAQRRHQPRPRARRHRGRAHRRLRARQRPRRPAVHELPRPARPAAG